MKFMSIFASAVFLSIHFGAILYVNSSLLGNFFESSIVSLVFFLGAIGNVILFLFAPKLIRQLGKRVFLIASIVLATGATLFLALASSAWSVALSSIIYTALIPMTYYCLDIFLEELSNDKKTGEIRGIYLTFINLGVFIGPLLLAFSTTTSENLQPIYIIATLLLIPPIFLSIFSLKSRAPKSHEPYHHSLNLPFLEWWHSRDIRRVTLARLVLEIFFSLMIIYVPIYLHVNLGFEWRELGIIFTVMLLPFVLFEWPVGEIADRWLGEKEIMGIGFVITFLSLLFMPFVGKVFLTWMVLLFISRVGASLVETTTESYFFKHVTPEDTGLLSIYRLARSGGNIVGILIGILTLSLFSYEKIFFVLAAVIFWGLKESLLIRDTR